MKSFTPEFERDRGGGVTRVSSKVILFTSLLVMNTRYLFLITALLSLPMFAWETVQAVIRHNSNYFYFFTITTDLLYLQSILCSVWSYAGIPKTPLFMDRTSNSETAGRRQIASLPITVSSLASTSFLWPSCFGECLRSNLSIRFLSLTYRSGPSH